MVRLGIRDEHGEAVANHSKKGIVKVYNRHEYQEEKKAALLKWEKELLRMVDQPSQEIQSEIAPLTRIEPLANYDPQARRDSLADFVPPNLLAGDPLFKAPIISFERCRTAIDLLTLIEIEPDAEKPKGDDTPGNKDPLAS